MRHRLDQTRQYLLEIVGFWTADYIQKKLAGLSAAGIQNLILAIDEERRCTDSDSRREPVWSGTVAESTHGRYSSSALKLAWGDHPPNLRLSHRRLLEPARFVTAES